MSGGVEREGERQDMIPRTVSLPGYFAPRNRRYYVVKFMARSIIALLLFTQATNSFSHSGGLDEYGCHTDSSNDTYHCHRSTSSSDSSGDGVGVLLALVLLAYLVSVSMENEETVKSATGDTDTSLIGVSPMLIDDGLGVKLWIKF